MPGVIQKPSDDPFINHRREVARLSHRKKAAEKLKDLTRKDVANPCRKKKFDDKDGFVVVIETMDRTKLDTIILSMCVTYKYADNIRWGDLKRVIYHTMENWLNNQDIWDRKNKIFYMEYPEDSNYVAKYKSFSFQMYFKRLAEPLIFWNDTANELIPLMEQLKIAIKNALDDEGVEIEKRAYVKQS